MVTVAQFHSHPYMQFLGQWKLEQRIGNISGSRTGIDIIFIWLESRFFPLSNDGTYVKFRAHLKNFFFGNFSKLIRICESYMPLFSEIFLQSFSMLFQFFLYLFWFFAGIFQVFCIFLTHLDRYGIFHNFGICFGTFHIHGNISDFAENFLFWSWQWP